MRREERDDTRDGTTRMCAQRRGCVGRWRPARLETRGVPFRIAPLVQSNEWYAGGSTCHLQRNGATRNSCNYRSNGDHFRSAIPRLRAGGNRFSERKPVGWKVSISSGGREHFAFGCGRSIGTARGCHSTALCRERDGSEEWPCRGVEGGAEADSVAGD